MNNRWNKVIAYMTAFVMFVSISMLVSCSSAPEQTDVPKESAEHENNENLIIPAFNPIYYYDGLLYYIKKPLGTPALLYYIDPENGESGILCGKPDCTHDSEECNACLDSIGDGFTVYRDKIYWLSRSIIDRKLMCEDIDGTNRQEVMALDKESEWLTSNMPFVEIYKDTLYRCGCGSFVSVGEAKKTMLLYCQPLQKGSEPKYLYKVEDVSSVVARIHENQLYFAVTGSEYDLSICVCNLDSGEVRELYKKDKMDNMPFDIAVYEDKLILHGVGPCVSIYSLTDGSYEVIGKEGHDFYATTGANIYEPTGQKDYCLYDMSGDMISQGEVDPPGFEESNYTQRYLGSIKETMLFLFEASYESKKFPGLAAMHSYIAAFNTDTLEWRILWDGVSDYE